MHNTTEKIFMYLLHIHTRWPTVDVITIVIIFSTLLKAGILSHASKMLPKVGFHQQYKIALFTGHVLPKASLSQMYWSLH